MTRRKIIPYHPVLKERAREGRNNPTLAEKVLWKALRKKQMRGYDFDRQKPLGYHIADFFCVDLMLAIEVDGGYHLNPIVHEKDKKKEWSLNELKINLLRFTNEEVLTEISSVLKCIEDYIDRWEAHHGGHTRIERS